MPDPVGSARHVPVPGLGNEFIMMFHGDYQSDVRPLPAWAQRHQRSHRPFAKFISPQRVEGRVDLRCSLVSRSGCTPSHLIDRCDDDK